MSVSQPTAPGHRQPTDNQVERVAAIKDAGNAFLEVLDIQPSSREFATARTKVEEAVMWAVKGVMGQ